jgi:hypothetical protein
MIIHNQLVKYKKNFIKKWFANVLAKMKSKLGFSKTYDKSIEDKINKLFPNELDQKQAKELLQELLTRNNHLIETLDVRMLDKQFVDLFGKAKFERIVTDVALQENILELSREELQTYIYLLNYHLVDFNERIANFHPSSCINIQLEQLQNLSEKDRLKAISILFSNSNFNLQNLSELNDYYEERKKMGMQIITNPQKAEEEYEKIMNSEEEISLFPFGFLYDMQDLSDIDRIKYAIIETKYGMSLEKAKILCTAFGNDVENIEQSEETRIIKELKAILEDNDIDSLRQINLDENYANYTGTINIVPNLRNAYLHKYQETLYQINDEDYIETQTVKTKGKKFDVKIYNVLGKNNDRADFNMILTSLGGIFYLNHNYDDLKADWDRADENHTISCSYIGNDFLGVVDESYLLAFSDLGENQLLRASNKDAGTVNFPFERYEDLQKNMFLTPENQKNFSKFYNELFIERKIEIDGKLVNRTPSFAVFIAESIDDIHDKKNHRWLETKRMAAELGIPVAVIDGTQCTKLEFEKVQEMVRSVKEEGRMDLIPSIIHKIENNRAAQMGVLKDVRNTIFSDANVMKLLEQIIGTIITSNISTFNQGIEEFAKVSKKIKSIYAQNFNLDDVKCKTYDYDAYLDRLKVLFSSRNGLNGDNSFAIKREPMGNQLKQKREEKEL